DRKPIKESYIWLGCLVANVISYGLTGSRVWYEGQVMLFIHIFVVWWILSRSGSLLEKESSKMLPVDALNGFVFIPFGNIFIPFIVIFHNVASLFRPRSEKKKHDLLQVLVALCAIYLFIRSFRLLLHADAGFQNLFSDFSEFLNSLFNLDINEEIIERFILAIPVSCYLAGLIIASASGNKSKEENLKSSTERFVENLRRMEEKFWITVIGLFSILYLTFFILQFSYLFSGFIGKLPEGFTVAEYARSGFFELCRVMAVNFALLWLSSRSVPHEVLSGKKFITCQLVILAESLVFALIALSKLGLYIHIYSFTPLRLQSSWLVTVLIAGCLLWISNILTGKKVFRKWMIFGAVSLSILSLI
ncbi:MAG: DUF4173 domain-containing protein, partial [Erysipelotrichaceae bacterium]|nr:DUF4173 domain-containing protein [Erysipelotrichaceae bacterium]